MKHLEEIVEKLKGELESSDQVCVGLYSEHRVSYYREMLLERLH